METTEPVLARSPSAAVLLVQFDDVVNGLLDEVPNAQGEASR